MMTPPSLCSCSTITAVCLCLLLFFLPWAPSLPLGSPPPSLLWLQPHPLSLLPSLRFFVDTYSHCFSPYPCPPYPHTPLPVTPCHGPIPLFRNEPSAWYVLILLIASPSWGWLSVLPASIWLNIDIDFDLMFSPYRHTHIHTYINTCKSASAYDCYVLETSENNSIIFRQAIQLIRACT